MIHTSVTSRFCIRTIWFTYIIGTQVHSHHHNTAIILSRYVFFGTISCRTRIWQINNVGPSVRTYGTNNARMMAVPQRRQDFRVLLSQLRTHTKYTTATVGTHYIPNEMSTLLPLVTGENVRSKIFFSKSKKLNRYTHKKKHDVYSCYFMKMCAEYFQKNAFRFIYKYI